MKIVFVLTALAGLVLLSVTLNATREGKTCMRFLKRDCCHTFLAENHKKSYFDYQTVYLFSSQRVVSIIR